MLQDTLQETLRNRLICGANHLGIQKCLLAEKDLTFEKALNIAKALEAAEKGHSGSQVRYRCTQFELSLQHRLGGDATKPLQKQQITINHATGVEELIRNPHVNAKTGIV